MLLPPLISKTAVHLMIPVFWPHDLFSCCYACIPRSKDADTACNKQTIKIGMARGSLHANRKTIKVDMAHDSLHTNHKNLQNWHGTRRSAHFLHGIAGEDTAVMGSVQHALGLTKIAHMWGYHACKDAAVMGLVLLAVPSPAGVGMSLLIVVLEQIMECAKNGTPVCAGEDAAVMGLVLLAVPSPTGARLSSLFVVTESQTLSFNLASGTKVRRPLNVVELALVPISLHL
eukprot:1158176-Pelagomonas_calceolata.AAC.7